MESLRAAQYNLSTARRLATIAGIAMMAAACTPDHSPKSNEVEASAAYVSTVEQDATPADASVNPYIDTSMLQANVESETKGADPADTDVYTWLFNQTDDNKKIGYELPHAESAAIMDITMDGHGKLQYDNHLTELTEQQSELLGIVKDDKALIEPAMKSGQVKTLHFRVFNGDPTYRMTTEGGQMMFVPHDYADGGKGDPSVYAFLPASSLMPREEVSEIIKHEYSHALLGQGEEAPVSAEEKRLFTEACGVIRDNAMRDFATNASDTVYTLESMKEYSPAKYDPVYRKVIRAMQNGTYQALQLPKDPNIEGVPACYVQEPLDALYSTAKQMGISEGALRNVYNNDDTFHDLANEAGDNWNSALKANTIYGVLSEGGYLKEPDEGFGHPYNIRELSASSTKLTLCNPGEFGKRLQAVGQEQRAAALDIIEFNMTELKEKHPGDAAFAVFVDKQYGQLQHAANG